MRIHKFRGKSCETHEWVYGSLLIDISGTYWIVPYDDPNPLPYVKWVRVIKETVGEFIGIVDINGKEIYEHDIILTQEFRDKPHSLKAKTKRHIGVVEYKIKEGYGFYNKEIGEFNKHKQYGVEWDVNIINMGKYNCYNWGMFFDCEVIGNIFDNPELLNKQGDIK